jgi:hypothetical protein
MTWGKQNTEAEAHEQLSYAWDYGINFMDTAGGSHMLSCASVWTAALSEGWFWLCSAPAGRTSSNRVGEECSLKGQELQPCA